MLSKNKKTGFTPTPTLASRLSAKPQLMPKLVSGFTFLETIVAVGILTIALASPLMLASSSIRAAGTAKDKFIASYLASEAAEFIKNARDKNSIAISKGEQIDWLDTIFDECGGTDGCLIDVTGSGLGAALLKCPQQCGNPIIKIKYEENSGLYQYQSGVDTKFTRTVKVKTVDYDGDPANDYEAEITVTVSWDGGGSPLIIQDNIFNWR